MNARTAITMHHLTNILHRQKKNIIYHLYVIVAKDTFLTNQLFQAYSKTEKDSFFLQERKKQFHL